MFFFLSRPSGGKISPCSTMHLCSTHLDLTRASALEKQSPPNANPRQKLVLKINSQLSWGLPFSTEVDRYVQSSKRSRTRLLLLNKHPPPFFAFSTLLSCIFLFSVLSWLYSLHVGIVSALLKPAGRILKSFCLLLSPSVLTSPSPPPPQVNYDLENETFLSRQTCRQTGFSIDMQ